MRDFFFRSHSIYKIWKRECKVTHSVNLYDNFDIIYFDVCMRVCVFAYLLYVFAFWVESFLCYWLWRNTLNTENLHGIKVAKVANTWHSIDSFILLASLSHAPFLFLYESICVSVLMGISFWSSSYIHTYTYGIIWNSLTWCVPSVFSLLRPQRI